MMYDAKPVTKGSRQHARPCRRADQSKMRKVQPDRARRCSLSDHDINRKVLHRRIQDLLHLTVQTVDFIDKQDISLL